MSETDHTTLCPWCGSEMKKQSCVYVYNGKHYRAWRCEKCQKEIAKIPPQAKPFGFIGGFNRITEEDK